MLSFWFTRAMAIIVKKLLYRWHYICIITANDTAKTDFYLAAIPLRTRPVSPDVVLSQQLFHCRQVLPSRLVFLCKVLQVGKLDYGNNHNPCSALFIARLGQYFLFSRLTSNNTWLKAEKRFEHARKGSFIIGLTIIWHLTIEWSWPDVVDYLQVVATKTNATSGRTFRIVCQIQTREFTVLKFAGVTMRRFKYCWI